ncbi:MAG: hypothetical protein H0T79_19800, partial [Deltaproteobacteria bacterium]|nr:hypothetical protein [Deltaproteobacteria bacterium]
MLLVADPERIAELVAALSEPLQQGELELVNSSGGDETIDLYDARRPPVVVVTASLEAGDAKSLIDAMREMSPRAQVSIVIVGDDTGPIRTALDAMELGPDRFVTRPLAAKALRYAVSGGLDAVSLVRGSNGAMLQGRGMTIRGSGVMPVPPARANGTVPPVEAIDDEPTTSTRSAMRARWEALADSMVEWPEGDPDEKSGHEPAAPPPPIIIKPRRRTEPVDEIAPPLAWRPGNTDPMAENAPEAPPREPTLIIRDPAPPPLPPIPPARMSSPSQPPPFHTMSAAPPPRVHTTPSWPPPMSPHDADSVVLAERGADDIWSEPVEIPELHDRDSKRDLTARTSTQDDLDSIDAMEDEINDSLDDFGDDRMMLGNDPSRGAGEGRLEILNDLTAEVHPRSPAAGRSHPGANLGPMFAPNGGPLLPDEPATVAADGRDFARQLRAKMSMMAQRLFQQSGDAASSQVDLAPRHDHHTEIDLSVVGEETPLGGGNTEIESRASQRNNAERELTTSPGSWDTQVRERGLPDAGELVRGTSDAALLLARAFATQTTCHIKFKKGEVEKIVYFDLGRPVFAASNEPLDRMGELLVREGKITASQYERCQAVVAESGRRMGEILVDFGYLKRRELLPAVRRHVEDILYSLFGWEHGHYQIVVDTLPSA